MVFFWTQDSPFQTRPPKNILLDSGNLDKQINLLGNFSFLSRLDLSENAAADEPDYQLRIIYNLPQVEDLDRKAVKPYVCSNSKLERIFSNFKLLSTSNISITFFSNFSKTMSEKCNNFRCEISGKLI